MGRPKIKRVDLNRKKLKLVMMRTGVTKKLLADELNVTTRTIENWISGGWPRDFLKRLCMRLGINERGRAIR